jgi:exodeoxyribonuclease VII large subunit
MSANTPISVAQLTATLRALLEGDPRLQDVWVQGEISNFKRAASGHLYFTLKDGGSAVRCVMWKSSANLLRAIPRDGDSVALHGYVSLYDANGDLQFYADRLRPIGQGDLYARFEQLKAQLAAEGLFDPARKRRLPAFPHTIGVVTSPDAAAFQDVQHVLRRRFPLVRLILAPTLVQGADAPPQITRALLRLDARDDIDAILICRGGGSIEDLWAFNDEALARAIAAARHPVISGVGHETDFTLCDFAADVRAPTPSAAAELLTPDAADLRAGVAALRDRLEFAVQGVIAARRDAVRRAHRLLVSHSPAREIARYRQRIDDAAARSSAAQQRRIALLRERLKARSAALYAASPDALLARGYVMLTDEATGARITRAASPAQRVRILFHDGARGATLDPQPEESDLP